MTEEMMNRLIVFLTCLCIGLLLLLAYQHERYSELVEQNHRMEMQIQTLSSQVNEVTAQWLDIVKRIKAHG
jgi:chaperonin cofactor prefoldin